MILSSYCSGGLKVKVKVLAGLFLSEVFLLGLQMADLMPHSPCLWFYTGTPSWFLFLFLYAHEFFWARTLPLERPFSLSTVTIRIGFLTLESPAPWLCQVKKQKAGFKSRQCTNLWVLHVEDSEPPAPPTEPALYLWAQGELTH